MAYSIGLEPVENDTPRYRTRLIIYDDDGEREHWDGGEPEDNSFLRDWAWVAIELRSAYEQGKKDAVRESEEHDQAENTGVQDLRGPGNSAGR